MELKFFRTFRDLVVFDFGILQFFGEAGVGDQPFAPVYADTVEVDGAVDVTFFQHRINRGGTDMVADGAPVFVKFVQIVRAAQADRQKFERIVTLGTARIGQVEIFFPEVRAESLVFCAIVFFGKKRRIDAVARFGIDQCGDEFGIIP